MTQITVRYYSIDSYGRATTRKFKTLSGARKFAQSFVGQYPEIGSSYAVSDDGVGKVTVEGARLLDLFPKLAEQVGLEAAYERQALEP